MFGPRKRIIEIILGNMRSAIELLFCFNTSDVKERKVDNSVEEKISKMKK